MSFEYSQEVANDYEKLFETDDEYDVIIYTGESLKEIHAHSIILRSRSQYFRTGFSMKWAEKKNGKFIFKKPNISPKIFKIILRFLYCGKINLTNLRGSDILSLLMAVDELNIQTLILFIQNYLIKCKREFLQQNSIEILELVYQHESFTDLWNYYLEKICGNPKILFNTDKFINLNASLLELFLKRDDLNLDEIKVWENLIKWGLAQEKNLNKDVSKWHQEEFKVLEKILHNFIPFIRFHEISSEDYIKRVNPYDEILSKELRDDILKFHSIPGYKPTFNLYTPRYSVGSIIINQKHVEIFSNWISRNKQNSKYIPYEFNLIFRGSRDGYDHVSFHNNCDNKGANIVIIKIKNSNQIVGGYNPLDWEGLAWKATTDSFIFSFDDYRNINTGRIGRPINKTCAVISDPGWGPVFGCKLINSIVYKYDLIMSPNGEWESTECSYPNIGIPDTFEVDDYEVFQIKKKTMITSLKKRFTRSIKKRTT